MVIEATEWEEWLVATQDCDLAFAPAESNDIIVELHVVLTEDPPADWGIRSRRLRLDEERYLSSEKPRMYGSPALLNSVADRREEELLDPARVQALKAWLGLRYDRPAVPTELVPLAKQIAKEIGRSRHKLVSAKVIDVMMQFDTSLDPPRYSLFGIVAFDEDVDEVRAWLAQVSAGVPQELGLADQIEAATPDNTSVTLLWTSYSADVSQITWSGPEQAGATAHDYGVTSHPDSPADPSN